MRNFSNSSFVDVKDRLQKKNEQSFFVDIPSTEFTQLSYFLVRNFYHPIIVDDYPYEILDKASFLEALYYQGELITTHDLNWDAFNEGLNDLMDRSNDFDGICLLFRNGKRIFKDIPNEMNVFDEILQSINNQHKQKKIWMILG